jgi:monoamine oxidase
MLGGDWTDGWRGFIDGAIEQGIIAGRAAAGILGK